MHTRVFPAETLEDFEGAYPDRPLKLRHQLLAHPLLTLEALAEFAPTLPESSVEYNPGDLPVGIAPEDVPPAKLGIAETIRSIEDAGAWMVIKRIEQHPDYAALLHSILDELEPVVRPKTGEMIQAEGFIFITSPGSVTPFHFDPEHNILLQIRGSKVMTVFPDGDETLFDPRVHEAFHLGAHHRNLPWRDEFAVLGRDIAIGPGEAIHVPVKTPHWVKCGPEVSISLSVTWRSQWSFEEADARAFNHMLRRIGIRPRAPGAFPQRNLVKSAAFRALRKAGIAPRP